VQGTGVLYITGAALFMMPGRGYLWELGTVHNGRVLFIKSGTVHNGLVLFMRTGTVLRTVINSKM
jgi:hypothetical protein